MNEAASLILSGAVGDRPATPKETAARGTAAALLAKRGADGRRPATSKARRPQKR